MNDIVCTIRLLLLIIGLTQLFACSNTVEDSNTTTETEQHLSDSANVKPIAVNQKPEAANLAKDSDLQKAIQTYIDDNDLKNAVSSICIMDLANGQVLGEHQSQKSITAASSLKVLTTAAALETLGNDFRFKTELQYDGQIENGVLKGNLYLKGYGDPTLGSDQMDEATNMYNLMNKLVQTCAEKGIQSIEGQVVGDASYLPSAVNAPTWQWSDLGNYYASGAWGLNMHENLYYLRFQQKGSLGSRPSIKEISPPVTDIKLNNELKSAGKGTGDNAYIYGSPYSNDRFVRGTIPVGAGTFSIKGAIPNPPLFAAQQLEKSLKNKGITTKNKATTQRILDKKNGQRTTIYTHQSPQLQDIAKRCNHLSVNLYCENMLRELGKQSGDGSTESGLEFLYNFWQQKGLNKAGLFLEDASGLSPRSSATSFHLAQALYLISKTSQYANFKKTLAIGGQTGTMKRMFKGSVADGKILAKSGSMSRVRSYTGYATSRAGRELSFSIITNNFNCDMGDMRKKMEKLMINMCQNL